MDEEEDDFYDPVDAVPTTQSLNHTQNAAAGQPQESNYMEDDDEVEEEEEDDVRTMPVSICNFSLLILPAG